MGQAYSFRGWRILPACLVYTYYALLQEDGEYFQPVWYTLTMLSFTFWFLVIFSRSSGVS